MLNDHFVRFRRVRDSPISGHPPLGKGGQKMPDADREPVARVAAARERFLTSEDPAPGSVREQILNSWRRSRLWEVDVDRLEPPYRSDVDLRSRLARSAAPVLDRLEPELADAPMTIVLADPRAWILDRRVGDRRLLRDPADARPRPGGGPRHRAAPGRAGQRARARPAPGVHGCLPPHQEPGPFAQRRPGHHQQPRDPAAMIRRPPRPPGARRGAAALGARDHRPPAPAKRPRGAAPVPSGGEPRGRGRGPGRDRERRPRHAPAAERRAARGGARRSQRRVVGDLPGRGGSRRAGGLAAADRRSGGRQARPGPRRPPPPLAPRAAAGARRATRRRRGRLAGGRALRAGPGRGDRRPAPRRPARPGGCRGAARPWVVGTSAGARVHDTLLAHFGASVTVPPLRYRIHDLHDLVPFLLERHAPGAVVGCTPAALRTLMLSEWPGNVGQLEQTLRAALERRRNGRIDRADLPADCYVVTRRVLTRLQWVERDAILEALLETRGNRTQAAAKLGISRATLYRRIDAFGIQLDGLHD